MPTHLWITADRRADREAALAGLPDLPPLLAAVEAHRGLRGPYTAAGSLLRAVGPAALAMTPELGPRHHVEIQQTTPELRVAVPEMGMDIARMAQHQTRYQAKLHTLRLSHGLVEFVRDHLRALGGPARTLVVHDAHEADHTDLEFLAVLLRRVPADLLTVVVTTGGGLQDSADPAAGTLLTTLAAHATAVAGRPTAPTTVGDARRFVDSDGTSDEPAHRTAYEQLDAVDRAGLHDRRAAELEARGEPSLALGAVPWHREHGSDPAGAGVATLRHAQVHCRLLGFYHAAVALGLRGKSLVDREQDWRTWWAFTADTIVCLASSGRAEEAEDLVQDIRRLSTDPTIQMHCAYELGMLYTRHYGDDRRDHAVARGWLNTAVAFAAVLPDPRARTFHSVFNNNGLALVEFRQGRPEEAVRLVTEGMERMDRELAPGEEEMHRTGLRYNRAQVFSMAGRLDEALDDLNFVIGRDRYFPDHYFNRAGVLRRLGRTAEAIEDYGEVLQLSPPFPEVYYNRADARMEVGDLTGALADYARVLDLDPTMTDARINRAGLLLEADRLVEAETEVAAGLTLDPADVHLLCLRATLLAGRGELTAARDAVSAALRADDSLAEAWALSGDVAFRAGDLDRATADFDRAVQLAGAPEMLHNRGLVHEAAGRYEQALADYDAVLAVVEDEETRHRRETLAASWAAAGPDRAGLPVAAR